MASNSSSKASSNRRQRGVILTPAGLERWQAAIRDFEVTANDGQRCSLEDLGDKIRIAPKTVAKVLKRQVNIDRRTLALCFEAFGLELQAKDYQTLPITQSPPADSNASPAASPAPIAPDSLTQAIPQSLATITHYRDWGEMPDTSSFYGRDSELTQLCDWINPIAAATPRMRLLAILGQGGVGKTALTAKLVQQLEPQFEAVFWRSVRNAPTLKTILTSLVQLLSDEQETYTNLLEVLNWLRRMRCLIVLDNVETLFQSGMPVGQYQMGYEDYGEFFQLIGEAHHNSCLILTSREKPIEIATAEGMGCPVRCIELSGSTEVTQAICQTKALVGTKSAQIELGDRYSHNPLVIKIVATLICDWFNGDIAKFLQQDTLILSNIRPLLNQQFDRLSSLEQSIMYWLAINREYTTLADLEADLFPAVDRSSLIEAIGSLRWRNLIEQEAEGYTQQPAILEFVSDRLIERICAEIQNWSSVAPSSACHLPAASAEISAARSSSTNSLFQTHVLLKVTADAYIQHSQIRLILQPIADRLLRFYGAIEPIKKQFEWILKSLRLNHPTRAGYAVGNLIDLYSQLHIDLTGYDFSGLPVWQADLRRNFLQQANFSGANFDRVSLFIQNFSRVLAVAFSPDGTLLATGDSRGSILIWEVTSRRAIYRMLSHASRITSLVWHPNGQQLASSSTDGTIRIWQINTSSQIHMLQHPNLVRTACWSTNGQMLASGGDDALIRLWDAETGTLLQTWQGHTDCVRSIQFSPDGQWLASGGNDRTIRIWEVARGQLLHPLQGHEQGVSALQFSPDGQWLASSSDDQTIRLWRLSSGKLHQILDSQTGWVWTVSWNKKGTLLASAGEDGLLRVWDWQTGRIVKQLQGHSSSIRSISWSPDGRLASGGEDQTVRLWQVEQAKLLATIQGRAAGVWTLDWHAGSDTDPALLASGSEDGTIHLWDGQNQPILAVLREQNPRIWSVAWQPVSRHPLLASTQEDGIISLWQPQTQQIVRQIQAHHDFIWQIAWSPDSSLLASASQDRTVKLWDATSGQRLRLLQGHLAEVTSVHFSPTGQTLASGSGDSTIRLWDVATGQLLRTLKGHHDRIMTIHFSPHGEWLASGSFDQTIRLWHWQSGTIAMILQGHTNQVWGVQFSPNGEWLASAGQDQEIRLWQVRTGECCAVLTGHRGLVRSIAWSPDSQRLASSSEDETIKIWSIPTGTCLKTWQAELPYQNMNITGIQGLSEATIYNLRSLGATQSDRP